MKKPLKVGFDLDGVLLYNPARIIRPILKTTKELLLKQKKPTFYVPQTPSEEFLWKLVHKSSMFISPGIEEIEDLVLTGEIQATIVTARFECLKGDYDKWVVKLNRNQIFKNSFYNHRNEQPHIFKERMLRKLKLDVYVEDNWDIVSYLHQSSLKTRIMWVNNILDKSISYPDKYSNLKDALKVIKQEIVV
jgi:hypothetical protein